MGLRAFYDAGALIAADRNDREMWALHHAQLSNGLRPITSAPVIAQASRDDRQANLHRLLKSCEIEPFAAEHSRAVGRLLARAETSDVVDAHVVHLASQREVTIITTDLDDLEHLSSHAETPVPVRRH